MELDFLPCLNAEVLSLNIEQSAIFHLRSLILLFLRTFVVYGDVIFKSIVLYIATMRLRSVLKKACELHASVIFAVSTLI